MIERIQLRHSNPWRLVALSFVLVFTTFGCEDGVTGGSVELGVFGTWSGVASLPVGRSATMTIEQSGRILTGTLRISAAVDATLSGAVDSAARTVNWNVAQDCERWSGTLNVSANENQMSGPLTIDRSGCQPVESSGSGTLSLTRG